MHADPRTSMDTHPHVTHTSPTLHPPNSPITHQPTQLSPHQPNHPPTNPIAHPEPPRKRRAILLMTCTRSPHMPRWRGWQRTRQATRCLSSNRTGGLPQLERTRRLASAGIKPEGRRSYMCLAYRFFAIDVCCCASSSIPLDPASSRLIPPDPARSHLISSRPLLPAGLGVCEGGQDLWR